MIAYLCVKHVFYGGNIRYNFTNVLCNSPFSGKTLASEKSRYRYFSVSLYRAGRRTLARVSLKFTKQAHHQECLHLILQFTPDIINIQDASVSPCLNTTVFLNRLEYVPAIVSIPYVTSQAEGDEEGLYGLRTVDSNFIVDWSINRRTTYRRIYRAS
jgi:hypothetical protein